LTGKDGPFADLSHRDAVTAWARPVSNRCLATVIIVFVF